MYKLALRGHSRSSAMSSFDRAHATSYATLIATVRLSCTVFEIWPVICRKWPILTHPTYIWRPHTGLPRSNFAKIFGVRKLESSAIQCCCFYDPKFIRFGRTPTCDRQTDKQTQAHSIYRASIASHGKKNQ